MTNSAEIVAATVLPMEKEIMPEGSVLVTGGDWDIYSAWYKQLARRERTDVLVVGANFMHQPWYPAFFTDGQKAEYGLQFASGVPTGAGCRAAVCRTGAQGGAGAQCGKGAACSPRCRTMPCWREWNRTYDLRVAARSTVGDRLTGFGTTCTLLRIDARDRATTAVATAPLTMALPRQDRAARLAINAACALFCLAPRIPVRMESRG